MASKRLPILREAQVGNEEFNRFLIANEQKHVWNELFIPDEGVLYADHNHAARDIQGIVKKNFTGLKPQCYVVSVYVQVFRNEPVSMNEVGAYLSRSSKLHIDTTLHSNGPDESLVLGCIHWHRIKPVKQRSND